MTERVNLYRAIHKAVRVSLSRLVAEAARTDFRDSAEAARLRELFAATFALLDDHAAHEDRSILPLLRTSAPEVAAKLQGAHADLDEMGRALRHMLGVAAQARTNLEGHAFLLQLSRYQAAQLAHMADEEELAQPALWRAYGDETLGRVQQEIIAAIPRETLSGLLELMLQSINAPEREELLSKAPARAA